MTSEPSVLRVHEYLTRTFPYTFRITIADNASTDDTWLLAQTLEARLEHVRAVHLPAKGRGRALRSVWGIGVIAILLHSWVDFSIQRTPVAILFFVMLGALEFAGRREHARGLV